VGGGINPGSWLITEANCDGLTPRRTAAISDAAAAAEPKTIENYYCTPRLLRAIPFPLPSHLPRFLPFSLPFISFAPIYNVFPPSSPALISPLLFLFHPTLLEVSHLIQLW